METGKKRRKEQESYRTMRIMVIDDDSTFLFIFRKQIEKLEEIMIVNESRNGSEAISYLKGTINNLGEMPDLIVLDLNMPVMDGWDFLDEYVKICENGAQKVPVCILSSTINQADFDRANTYESVKSFFSKPITSEQLKTMKKISEIY
ncbi:response regulator [Cryomorphaceae bacterium 1068]|nr:response regulator [Cryomorphaceae bacterium 1068]